MSLVVKSTLFFCFYTAYPHKLPQTFGKVAQVCVNKHNNGTTLGNQFYLELHGT